MTPVRESQGASTPNTVTLALPGQIPILEVSQDHDRSNGCCFVLKYKSVPWFFTTCWFKILCREVQDTVEMDIANNLMNDDFPGSLAEEEDQQRALTDMQGVFCGNRPMRISTTTPKRNSPLLFPLSSTWAMHCYTQKQFSPACVLLGHRAKAVPKTAQVEADTIKV